jgi:hypothetical protein
LRFGKAPLKVRKWHDGNMKMQMTEQWSA